MVALRQTLDPRQPVEVIAGAQTKPTHGDLVGLSGGLGEILSPDGTLLECMQVAVLKDSSGFLVTSTGPEGELVAALARGMGGGGPQDVRHNRSLVVA